MDPRQDPQLKEQLGQIDHIKTARTFRRWKSSFLTRWEEFLEEANVADAGKAYRDFSSSMVNFAKLIGTVNNLIEKGDLTVNRTTVKARHSLSEMSKVLTMVIDEEDALIPQTVSLEHKCGYNKFHMGAVLIRDNFGEYGQLCDCRDILQQMRTQTLNEVADKQILEEMDNYKAKLKKFCDVMADMGLFEVMLKCREFDTVDDGPDLDNLIFIDIKTLGMGELSREDCLLQKILTARGADADNNEIFAEAATNDALQKLRTMIEEHPTLGFGSGKSNNAYKNEDGVSISEIEKVQNMWGVKLKKTPKNVKGEELLFVDQKTGAFGELSRHNCIERGLVSEGKDENGRLILNEAALDFEERAGMIERVRKILRLGIDKDP